MRPGIILHWHALKSILESEIKVDFIILDIGGYDGFIASNIKRFFPNFKITVVDIDKSGLQLARDRGLNTLYASSVELPIKDNQVDIILCLDLIEHIKEDNKVIKEISRVLKMDGKVILTTPMENGVSFPFLSKEKIKTVNENCGHIRKGYFFKQIRDLFVDNNLMVIKRNKYFNFLTRLTYWFNLFSGIPLRGKNLLYSLVVKLEPYLKYGAEEHIIIAAKVKS